jgi:tRNA 2-thiouridine synthesizing protein E
MNAAGKESGFPFAPAQWTPAVAQVEADNQGLQLGEDHWNELRALQEYYSRHDEKRINVRELHDALEERFHDKGGVKYLYELFPGGPIAQGCRLAGLEPPSGAEDRGFGSVV